MSANKPRVTKIERTDYKPLFIVSDLDRINGSIHADEFCAISEARDLASKFPGNRIRVFQEVYSTALAGARPRDE